MKHCSKLIISLLLITLSLSGQDIPEPMSPPRLVNDFSNIFDNSQRNDLEQMLRNYNDTTSTQIYVVTVNDLQGYAVSDYAVQMGEKWGIGQKDKNNGVLILIKPRIGNNRGQVFIATGYGVEHILTDGRCGRIIDNYMIPYLQDGDYYNASKSAVQVIIEYLSGEFDADKEEEGYSTMSLIFNILFIIGIIYLLYKISKNNGSGGNSSSRGGGFGRGYRGYNSSGRSGGGVSFGGGGGGSFGGGGAGRSF